MYSNFQGRKPIYLFSKKQLLFQIYFSGHKYINLKNN